jgi:transketolase
MRQTALDTVYALARKDPRIVFVGSDLGADTLKEMKVELPNQFFMEGISEQHLIGFVAGLAKEGFIPYVNTIANFLTRRAFEQIAMDIALHNLPVKLLASGGGMVYAPLGPTHTAVDDLALMSSVPNFRIFSPGDANEMRELLLRSVGDSRPWYIRFGKGGEPAFSPTNQLEPCKPKLMGDTKPEVLFLTTGVLVHEVLQAMDKLKKSDSRPVGVVHFPELTCLDFESWKERYLAARLVIVVEEHMPNGGLFSRILNKIHSENLDTRKIRQRSLPFTYLHNYGTQQEHLYFHGLDAISLLNYVKSN